MAVAVSRLLGEQRPEARMPLGRPRLRRCGAGLRSSLSRNSRDASRVPVVCLSSSYMPLSLIAIIVTTIIIITISIVYDI